MKTPGPYCVPNLPSQQTTRCLIIPLPNLYVGCGGKDFGADVREPDNGGQLRSLRRFGLQVWLGNKRDL